MLKMTWRAIGHWLGPLVDDEPTLSDLLSNSLVKAMMNLMGLIRWRSKRSCGAWQSRDALPGARESAGAKIHDSHLEGVDGRDKPGP